MKTTLLAAIGFCYAVCASPLLTKRQDLDFDSYEAIDQEVPVAAPIGAVSEGVASIVYDPTAAANSAIKDAVVALTVTSAAAAATFDAVQTIVPAIVVPTNVAPSVVVKRQAAATPADGSGYIAAGCVKAQPAGNGPPTTGPDTAAAFLANSVYSNAANGAVTPGGYTALAGFVNRQASAQDPSYLTYTMSGLTTYDPSVCAALCNKTPGCFSFNIYYERDPSFDPNSNCLNPPSITALKCAIYGAPLTANSATNVGQWRNKFQVVIAGSNAYVKNAPAAIPGFTGPVSLGNASINAPYSYIGVQTFPQSQPFDPSVCAAACLKTTQYDRDHINTNGIYDTCRFFDAYVLYKNGAGGVFTCAYYTLAWDKSYATNFGQYDQQGNHFTIQNSYTYALNSVQQDGTNGVSYYTYGPTSNSQFDFDYNNMTLFKGSTSRKGTYSDFIQQMNYQEHTATVLHGFFIASQAGKYTFDTGTVDDIFYLWHGDKALSGWTSGNYDLHTTFRTGGSWSITLPQGYPLPITMIYGNNIGQYAFHMTITFPDGTSKKDSDVMKLFVPPNASNNPFDVPA